MDAQRIKERLIERGTTESAAEEMAAAVSGPTATTKECMVVIRVLAEIKYRIGLSEALWTLKSDTERKREAFSAAARAQRLTELKATGQKAPTLTSFGTTTRLGVSSTSR